MRTRTVICLAPIQQDSSVKGVALPRNRRQSCRTSIWSGTAFLRVGEACEHGEIAMQLNMEAPTYRSQHNAVDEASHNLGGFGHGIGRIERLGKTLDLAAIDLGEVGMESQHRPGLAGAELHFCLR